VAYLGRLNYAAAMVELIAGNYLTASQVGLIATAFFASYGTGQLVSGFMGDKIRPKIMMFVGFVISIAANIIVGFAPSAAVMGLVWGTTLVWWIIIAAAGAMICLPGSKMWKKFKG